MSYGRFKIRPTYRGLLASDDSIIMQTYPHASLPAFLGAPSIDRAVYRRFDAGVDHDLEAVFAALGGCVTCDELSILMRGRFDQPISCIARWIVQDEIISFERFGQTLFPMFQFDPSTLCVKRGVGEVAQLLAAAFDKEESAQWFAEPNEWLDGHSPASIIGSDLAGVREAARADRFVVLG